VTQTEDIYLLANEPDVLVDKYSSLVNKVLNKYIDRGQLGEENYDQTLLSLKERLPNQLDHLAKKNKDLVFVKTLFVQAASAICEDFSDIYLLEKKSPELVLKYIPSVKGRIKSKVGFQSLSPFEFDDIVQMAQEKLLIKLKNGSLNRFSGQSLFKTFLYRVTDNIIIDILRQIKNKTLSISLDSLPKAPQDSGNIFEDLTNSVSEKEQTELIEKLMLQFSENDFLKFELCCKLHYGYIVKPVDIEPLGLDEDDQLAFLQHFGNDFSDMSKDTLWDTLNRFINIYENKLTSSSNLWKWFGSRRNRLIVKLLSIYHLNTGATKSYKKLNDVEKALLEKVNDRQTSKLADVWFGQLFHFFLQKNDKSFLK